MRVFGSLGRSAFRWSEFDESIRVDSIRFDSNGVLFFSVSRIGFYVYSLVGSCYATGFDLIGFWARA